MMATLRRSGLATSVRPLITAARSTGVGIRPV
jgi:hypothetical protein